jgi:hypothetical protein
VPRDLDEVRKDRVGSTPTVSRHTLYAMIDAYRELPGNGSGGALHIVVDDQNLDTDDILWCRARLAEADERGLAIADALLAMTHRQRWKVFR